jgi:hypothetical protein
MAHFYGTLQGARGQASRLGTRNSGLRVEACSWQGKVVVTMRSRDGVDYAEVSLQRHQGHGTSLVVYDGPVAGMPVAVAA